jgi:hypothetical protein
MTEEDEFPPAVPKNGSLSLAGRGLEKIPWDVAKQYGSEVKSLDISHNKLSVVFILFFLKSLSVMYYVEILKI